MEISKEERIKGGLRMVEEEARKSPAYAFGYREAIDAAAKVADRVAGKDWGSSTVREIIVNLSCEIRALIPKEQD